MSIRVTGDEWVERALAGGADIDRGGADREVPLLYSPLELGVSRCSNCTVNVKDQRAFNGDEAE